MQRISKPFIHVSAFIAVLCFASISFAQATGTTSGKSRSRVSRSSSPEFSLRTTLARTNSLYRADDGRELSTLDLTVSPTLKATPQFAITGFIEAVQDLKSEKFGMGRASLGVNKPSGFTLFNHSLKLVPRASFGFPISDDSKADSLQLATTLGARFMLNPDVLATKRIRFGFDLSGTRYIHQYETAIDGGVNAQYASGQTFDFQWLATEMLSLSLSLTHYDTFSYQGAHRDYIAHGQELGIQATKRLSFELGHSFGAPYASTRKTNGKDLNFELVDDVNSIVYGQLTFAL